MVLPLQLPNGTDHSSNRTQEFCINDHMDLLIEILKRMDGHSLGVAASVCYLWYGITRNDSLWEHHCFRSVESPPSSAVRPVVLALGGYRMLYMVCVRPILKRLGRRRKAESEVMKRLWSRQEVEVSLSLFCVDYYERLVSGGKSNSDATASSLMFLCKTVVNG